MVHSTRPQSVGSVSRSTHDDQVTICVCFLYVDRWRYRSLQAVRCCHTANDNKNTMLNTYLLCGRL